MAGAGAFAWFVPVVDLHRERSLIAVQANGGNAETYRINLPKDRIMVGLPGAENSIPAGLAWPADDLLGNFQAEIFKIRDRNNVVIGVASRLASSSDASAPFIEWSIHLPARGSIYAQMDMLPAEDGYRNGSLRSGTRDFQALSGVVREHFIAEIDDEDDNVESRIELVTALIGSAEDDSEYLADAVADNQEGSL